MKLVFDVAVNSRLVFAPSAVEQMMALRQTSKDLPEAGGVLLGRHLIDCEDLVVDEVTVPQDSDRRSRFSFYRSRQHQKLALAKWEVSLGHCAYLGLWHTHPESDPSPSCIDKRDWTRAVAKGQFEGDWLFFPIVGVNNIRVWGKTRDGSIVELNRRG